MRYIVLLLVLLIAVPAYSQTIELKSGKIINGRIVEQSDKFIKVDVGGIAIKYYFEDIVAMGGQPLVKDDSEIETASEDIDRPIPIKIFAVEWNMPDDINKAIHAGVWTLQGIYNDIFDLHFRKDFVAKIRIFGDEKYFFGYQRMASTTSSNTGFYTSKVNEAVTYWRKDTQLMLALVFHEINHALMHNVLPYQPSWLDEGISEYFENMLVEEDSIIIVPSKIKSVTLKQRLRWDSVMDVEKFLKMSDQEWSNYENLPDNPARGISWSIVFFLMESNKGIEALKKILHHIKEVGDKEGISFEAFNLHYPGGVAQFEKDWHKWIPEEKLLHVYPIADFELTVKE